MSKASRYLKPRPRFVTPLLCLSMLLGVGGAWLSAQAYREYLVVSRLTQRVDVLRKAQAARPAPKLSLTEVEQQKRWVALKLEREFAWPPLFAAVEHAGNTDIELLELQPDKDSRRVLLRGEARNAQALIAFVDALAIEPAFKNVHLTHQQNRVRGRLETVIFEIKASMAG